MSGPEFKKICEKNGFSVVKVAEDLGVSANTIWLWFRVAVLDRRTELALTQLGYLPQKEGNTGRAAARA